MNNKEIIAELQMLYLKFTNIGDFNKAQEIMMKIADLKSANESDKPPPKQNILLG